MLTVDGIGGGGTSWVAYRLRTRSPTTWSSTGKDWPINAIAMEVLLPPPDGKQYPASPKGYGPRTQTFDTGWIESSNAREPYKPCSHSSFDGGLVYLGDDPAASIRWKLPQTGSTNNLFSWNAGDLEQSWWSLDGKKLYSNSGRACTSTSRSVFDRDGSSVLLNCTTSNNQYWYYDARLCGNTVARDLGTVIPSGGAILMPGTWICRNSLNGNYPGPNAREHVHYQYQTISRPDPLSIEVIRVHEYYSTDSYCPGSSKAAWAPTLGFGGLYEGHWTRATYHLVSLRSPARGEFYMTWAVHFDETRAGWNYPNTYVQSASFDETYEAATPILYPGLVNAGNLDLTAVNHYCQVAPDSVKLTYDKYLGKMARSDAFANAAGLETNWLENLAQAKGTLDVVVPLIEGYRAFKTGNITAARRALAGAYLTYKYVISPAISDTTEVVKKGPAALDLAIRTRFSRERRRGRRTKALTLQDHVATQEYACTLILALKDNAFSQLWNALERLGLDPSAANLWDLVPFSFVIDWFTSIGDALDRISCYVSGVLNRELIARIESFKVQWPVLPEELVRLIGVGFRLAGDPIRYRWYQRSVYTDFGSFDPLLGLTSGGLTLNQMVQGGALITSFGK